MNNQEDINKKLYQYIIELRDYIEILEGRIAILENKVNPPKTVDIGGGKRTFTRHGIQSLFDDMYEDSRRKRFGKK